MSINTAIFIPSDVNTHKLSNITFLTFPIDAIAQTKPQHAIPDEISPRY